MSESLNQFYIFAEDHQAYGPAHAELLQQWAKEGLISSESWVYDGSSDSWHRAKQASVLKGFLVSQTRLSKTPNLNHPSGLRGSQLRRIRLFADMTDEQAEKFVGLVEKVQVRAFSPIVKQGEHGDSMFLILEGEARVSVRHQEKEDTIAMLGVGDFFGEISLLDEAPRSADVIANKDCVLLRLSKKNLDDMISKNPELSSRFLIAMNRFLGGRIRATNERFAKAQSFARGTAGQITAPSSMKWNKGF